MDSPDSETATEKDTVVAHRQNGSPVEVSEKHLPKAGRSVWWLLLFVVVYLGSSLLYLAGYSVYLSMTRPGISSGEVLGLVEQHVMSLDALAGMYILQFVCLAPLVIIASQFDRQSWRETLAIKRVPGRTIAFWAGVWVVYQVISSLGGYVFDVPVDDFLRSLSGSGHIGAAVVIILLAPLLEEAVFRGYLHRAWRPTWLGAPGTILATSILFSLLHVGQYNVAIMLQLFVLSVLLGVAREKTGSLLVPIFLHFLNNAYAGILIIFFGVI